MFLFFSITFRQKTKFCALISVVCCFIIQRLRRPLWSYVLRQPLNSASPHFWTQPEHRAGEAFEFKEMCVRQRDRGKKTDRNGRWTFKGRATEVGTEKKALWMDALLIALNHSAPLCLRRCVDTTSANTQGRCWLPLVINRWKMT